MKDVSIGLFIDAFVPIMDGVTLTVKNYAYWLNKTLGPSFVVAPFAPNHVDREEFPVIRYLSLPTIVRPPYRVGVPDIDFRLQYKLRKRSFSLVHAHTPFSSGLQALKTAKEKQVPIVATFHSKYRDDLSRVVKVKPIVDETVKKIVDFYYSVDHVWVPQAAVGQTLREYGYKGPYEVVENGIDLVAPANISPYYAKGQSHLGLADDELMGLFVGQHILEKNIEFLMRSLPEIMARVPRFRMVFVGEGYAKRRLQDLAEELGVSGRIIFHAKVQDRELLKTIYARANLFLFPSIYDNAPLVVREAAAFRTPSLLIDGSTAAEIIRDGENGFVARNEVDAYAARAIEILSNPAATESAGFGAQRSLCRTWEDVVREVRNRYLDILSRWSH